MKKALIGIVLNALALFATTQLVTSIEYSGGLKLFLFGGIIMGLLNTFVKPVIKILGFPLILMSGGLILIVINVFMLWLATSIINGAEIADLGLHFEGFGTYIIAAIVFGLVNWAEHLIIKNK